MTIEILRVETYRRYYRLVYLIDGRQFAERFRTQRELDNRVVELCQV